MGSGRVRLSLILLVLTLAFMPVSAFGAIAPNADGSRAQAFQRELKAKHIKLKKYKVGGTTLYADTKLKKKRVALIKKWILGLPKKVRKKAKRIYFVRRKYYLMTGTNLKETCGYSLFPSREIWLYNVSDSDELQDTLYHEFGHCWDWNIKKKKFTLSTTNQWEGIWVNWLGAWGDPQEYYAMIFAEYYSMLQDPDYAYIAKSLK